MNIAVLGAQWGDEGKGKVVDLYSNQANFIVRFQGGNNAGHTLVVNGKKTILHLIPSGILHPGKTCLIANGVVFDPIEFFEEVEGLVQTGALSEPPANRIKVSERAHVILPYHRQLDRLREEKAKGGKGKIGTTVRGIGPAYEDKVARRGIQVIDLVHPELLREKLERSVEEKNVLLQNYYGEKPILIDAVYEQCLEMGQRLKPYMSDVRRTLMAALKSKEPILFEGAQGTLLDIDHGTYPYVTSSSVVAGGILTGCGVGNESFDQVIGITKAYCTRVGTGPFPTELRNSEEELGKKIQTVGAEFGATTGRPRRTGWLDLVALKYACEVNGLTGLALMKLDVLDGFDQLKICTAYKIGDREVVDMPSCVEEVEKIEPVYESVHGWPKYEHSAPKSREQLPEGLQAYLKRIEDFVGVPIILISTGPGREETLQFANPFDKAFKPSSSQ